MELKVLALIGEGLTTTEIADHMRRAVKTVEGHRYQIGKKLGIGNRVKLARAAIRAGIAPLHPLPHESSNGSWNGHADDED
jgi:DNA-binding NarL/FixJ family response regulator